MNDTLGLTGLATRDLKTLLRVLHRGELTCPLTIVELTRFGLQEPAEFLLRQLRGLDAAGVRAVLTCVLAERVAQERRSHVEGGPQGDTAVHSGGSSATSGSFANPRTGSPSARASSTTNRNGA